MGSPLDTAAEKVGSLVAKFVDASDRLVNLLREDIADMNAAALARHEADVEKAMNAYDIARRDLTGEDVSSA